MSSIFALAYMVACVLFIRGIKLMGKASTAKKGNLLSAIGMLVATVTVFFEKTEGAYWSNNPFKNPYTYIVIAIIIGSAIGVYFAKKVEMTGMPELVALFNGFGGLSSLLVAISQHISYSSIANRYYDILDNFDNLDILDNFNILDMAEPSIDFKMNKLVLALTIAIGAIAFTGSVVAWGKLSGKLFKKPIVIPNKNIVNLVLTVLGVLSILLYTFAGPVGSGYGILLTTVIFLVLGFTMVISIGGGDMPVIISFLNALSGIAAAFAGFVVLNSALVVSGCLVGTSGLILTLIMCKAMNRSFFKLLFGSFGVSVGSKAKGEEKEAKAISVEDAYLILEAAKNVVFIPGYGMAVAQAQHAVKELTEKLEENGAEVNFAIHPVAGRMPGHMNVLLAEADIPYEKLKTADEMNPQMPMMDVAIVIGANDVVNPAALEDESSPIYGMPIINAHQAKTVFVLKRGKGTGFSGIENPLFTNENTVMIYGDGKQTVQALVGEFDE